MQVAKTARCTMVNEHHLTGDACNTSSVLYAGTCVRVDAKIPRDTEDVMEYDTDDNIVNNTGDNMQNLTDDNIVNNIEDYIRNDTDDNIVNNTGDNMQNLTDDNIVNNIEDNIRNDTDDNMVNNTGDNMQNDTDDNIVNTGDDMQNDTDAGNKRRNSIALRPATHVSRRDTMSLAPRTRLTATVPSADDMRTIHVHGTKRTCPDRRKVMLNTARYGGCHGI